MEEKFDVVIVGTGATGMFAALNLSEDLNILMITKDQIENSNSYLAQGGICTLKDPADYDAFFEDTLKAGRYENNHESVKAMIEDSPEIEKLLVQYGVEFDKNEKGQFSYTKEGAHSISRILHHKDTTGREITSKLIARAKEQPNIEIREFTSMIDWVIEDGKCTGILTMDLSGEVTQIISKVTILATGGMGGLFEHSTNFTHITGDSFALAIRHDIELQNLDYVQIHPTALYSEKPGRGFLISESVRGEGAVLLNNKGERFVDELLPRDKVSAAIQKEMEKTGTDHVYLSLVGKPEQWIKNRFPNIYQACLDEGYDLTKEPIPVVPTQHYVMGGIKTNTLGETSVENLYAVGETGCNGVHGANRLASNSLLEGLVFARRAAGVVNKSIGQIPFTDKKVSLDEPFDKQAWQDENRELVMREIKRKDKSFYDKWCNGES